MCSSNLATGGATITDYKYAWSTNGGGTWSSWVSAASTSSPVVITGLTNGTAYQVKLRAVNEVGDGAESAASSATTPYTVPSAPTLGTITPGDAELSVAFTLGGSGGSVVTNVEYSTDDGSSWTTPSPASTTSPIVVTGLTNGTTYQVKVRAVNAAGSGAASSATAGTPRTVPGAATITGVTGGEKSLSVAFTAGSDGGASITDYKYALSTNGGGTWSSYTSAGSTTSPISISGLLDGTTYLVKVRAVNTAGDGAESNSLSAATWSVPGAPSISAVTPSAGQLSVDFVAGSTGGASITDYKYALSTNGGSSWSSWVSAASTSSPVVITDRKSTRLNSSHT